MSKKVSNKNSSKISKQENLNDTSYSYMNPVEHVYKIPDTYIGSVEP